MSTSSLKPVGNILLVVGAGGIFGAVLKGSGIADALADTFNDVGLPVILLAWLISVVLRVAQGSATVAIVTTAGIVVPLVEGQDMSQAHLALIIMAISAGSIFASHVNDGGLLDGVEVLRHHRTRHPEVLDGPGNGPVGGGLRGGGAAEPGDLGPLVRITLDSRLIRTPPGPADGGAQSVCVVHRTFFPPSTS